MADDSEFIWGEDRRDREEIPEEEDPLVVDDLRKAVIISQWRTSQTIAMGDKEKAEWITADPDACVEIESAR